MNAIHPIAETEDTVTLRRVDFERMLEAVEDAEDVLALQAAERREGKLGTEAARADCLPVELVMRLLDGEHPVCVWRGHRGLSLPELADRAGVARSDLDAIERGRTPGTVMDYRRLAEALGLTVDDLLPADTDDTAA